MAGKDIAVQWAWRGKELNDSGYRILSCSTGGFNAKNFDDILDRFSPGTLADPSQVAVSYVLPGDGSRHLGMAIYEPAVGGVDRFGRDVMFTRYFCVPFDDVALSGVSYMGMYGTLKNRALPQANEPPFSVAFPRGDQEGIPDKAARALQVTELLLTGNPVCIVDAGSTSMEERLAFIDAVMRLLPYGMRAEMAAATWTSSVYRQHKFRLFFSEAPRKQPDSGPGDHLVAWRPDRLEIRPALTMRFNPEWAGEYQDWLRPLLERSVTERLVGQTDAKSFKAADVLKLVESAPRVRDRNIFRLWNQGQKGDAASSPPVSQAPRLSGEGQGAGAPAGAPQQAGRPGAHAKPDPGPADDRLVLLINRLERDLRGGNAPFVEAAVEQLAAELRKDQPSDAQRRSYQAIIKRDRLLREGLELGKNKKGPFYKVLLRAAFGVDITYAHYLRIEEMLNGEAPHKQLMQVIDEATSDQRLKFIMTYQLSGGRPPNSIFNPMPLIDMAADPELRDDHAEIIWGVLIVTLETLSSGDRGMVRDALRERGFLAHRLRARNPLDQAHQASALVEVLAALYGRPMPKEAIPDIFVRYRHAPTEALLVAALQLINPDEDDALPHLLYYFLDSYARAPEIGQDLRAGFARFGYGDDPGATPGATADNHDTGETRLDGSRPVPSDAVRVMYTRTADPQGPRRRLLDRVVNRHGEFPQTAAKEAARRQHDDRE